MESHLAFSLLEHTCLIILRLVHLHKLSRDEQHIRASRPQQKAKGQAKGKSRAQRDAVDLLSESLMLAFNSSMQMLTQLLGIICPLLLDVHCQMHC